MKPIAGNSNDTVERQKNTNSKTNESTTGESQDMEKVKANDQDDLKGTNTTKDLAKERPENTNENNQEKEDPIQGKPETNHSRK